MGPVSWLIFVALVLVGFSLVMASIADVTINYVLKRNDDE